jgi:hypothetical protein
MRSIPESGSNTFAWLAMAWLSLTCGVGSFVVLFLFPKVGTHRSPRWPTPGWEPFLDAVLLLLPVWFSLALFAYKKKPTAAGRWALGINGLQIIAISCVLAARLILE